jgi:elongation factor Ts
MEITASLINQLRQQTGAGMMDCKKALTESGGDFEKAIDYLRKKGQKVSALRAGKEANEGVVVALVNSTADNGVILSLNCETDFVAKNEDFISFAANVASRALEENVNDLHELNSLHVGGKAVSDHLSEMVGKIGEKIELRRFEKIQGAFVVPYIHSNRKLGVMVAFNKSKSAALEATGKDIAMQIAAMNPVSIDESTVPQHIIDRELDIAREKAKAEGKPDNIIDKIAAGSLNKFFKENTLLHQEFVKDNKKSISDVLRAIDKEVTVTAFHRISVADS